MKIVILGRGCKKSLILEENVKKAVKKRGIAAKIDKIEDKNQIMEYGIIKTPALLINGSLIAMGDVPDPEEIELYLG